MKLLLSRATEYPLWVINGHTVRFTPDKRTIRRCRSDGLVIYKFCDLKRRRYRLVLPSDSMKIPSPR